MILPLCMGFFNRLSLLFPTKQKLCNPNPDLPTACVSEHFPETFPLGFSDLEMPSQFGVLSEFFPGSSA